MTDRVKLILTVCDCLITVIPTLFLIFLKPRAVFWKRMHSYPAEGKIISVRKAYTKAYCTCYQLTVSYTDQNGISETAELHTCQEQLTHAGTVMLSVAEDCSEKSSIADLFFCPGKFAEKVELLDRNAGKEPFNRQKFLSGSGEFLKRLLVYTVIFLLGIFGIILLMIVRA